MKLEAEDRYKSWSAAALKSDKSRCHFFARSAGRDYYPGEGASLKREKLHECLHASRDKHNECIERSFIGAFYRAPWSTTTNFRPYRIFYTPMCICVFVKLKCVSQIKGRRANFLSFNFVCEKNTRIYDAGAAFNM